MRAKEAQSDLSPVPARRYVLANTAPAPLPACYTAPCTKPRHVMPQSTTRHPSPPHPTMHWELRCLRAGHAASARWVCGVICALSMRHLRSWRAASLRWACLCAGCVASVHWEWGVCALHARCDVSGCAASTRWAFGVCALGVRRLHSGRAVSARWTCSVCTATTQPRSRQVHVF